MSWIREIPFSKATHRLKKLYKRISGQNENIDNIMMAHSLRPHTMEGHMILYKGLGVTTDGDIWDCHQTIRKILKTGVTHES